MSRLFSRRTKISKLWSLFSRPPSFVQKEEGLREEHGSARQIARGPLRGAARRFRRNARDRKGELANPKGFD